MLTLTNIGDESLLFEFSYTNSEVSIELTYMDPEVDFFGWKCLSKGKNASVSGSSYPQGGVSIVIEDSQVTLEVDHSCGRLRVKLPFASCEIAFKEAWKMVKETRGTDK